MRSASNHSPRLASVLLMLIGVVIAAFALLADTFNIGGGHGFGYYQMIALIAGVVIFLLGIALILGSSVRSDASDNFRPDS